jgi:hypothetical protein
VENLVEKKREIKTPIEIQKQAVDLDEKMPGVAAPAVGPWQRQLNELVTGADACPRGHCRLAAPIHALAAGRIGSSVAP